MLRTLAAIALLAAPGFIANAQTAGDVPVAPDCSLRDTAATATLDCGALARIDAAASEMVTSGYTPGLVVAISHHGRIVFARGYGLANIEAGLAATPSSVFPILSVTKPFTAAAVMQLRDAGRLSLDDPVSKYLPFFPRGATVRLRHLLSHTSGIHDFDPGQLGALSSDSLVHLIAAQSTLFDFTPGERYSYSNANYALLARIVELTSGRPWRAYVRDSVVARVPYIATAADVATEIVPGRASTYLRTTIPGRFANGPRIDPSLRFGSGSMRSSALDLLAWLDAFVAARITGMASLREMMTPARLNDGTLTGGGWGAYGYGLEIARCGGHALLGHGGADATGSAIAHHYTEDDFTLIILANTSHTAAELEPRLLRQIFGRDRVTGSCN